MTQPESGAEDANAHSRLNPNRRMINALWKMPKAASHGCTAKAITAKFASSSCSAYTPKPQKPGVENNLDWIKAQPADNFTLQVMVLSNKVRLQIDF